MKEYSFGVIPVFKKSGNLTFLLVKHNKKGLSHPPAGGQNGLASPTTVGGHWAFPKGHSEKGETPPETALRELQEETGISDVMLDTEKTFEEHYIYAREGIRMSKTVTYYIGFVRRADVTVQSEEIADFFWATYEEAREQMTFKEGKRMLSEAYAYLKSTDG